MRFKADRTSFLSSQMEIEQKVQATWTSTRTGSKKSSGKSLRGQSPTKEFIYLKDNSFLPDYLEVPVNTNIVIRNEDRTLHDIQCNNCTKFKPFGLASSGEHPLSFDKPGKYVITSENVVDMKCTIEVTAEDENASSSITRKYFPTTAGATTTSTNNSVINENNHNRIIHGGTGSPLSLPNDIQISEKRDTVGTIPKPLSLPLNTLPVSGTTMNNNNNKKYPQPDYVRQLEDKKKEWNMRDKTIKNTQKNIKATAASPGGDSALTPNNNNNMTLSSGDEDNNNEDEEDEGEDDDSDSDSDLQLALSEERHHRKYGTAATAGSGHHNNNSTRHTKIVKGYAVTHAPRVKIKESPHTHAHAADDDDADDGGDQGQDTETYRDNDGAVCNRSSTTSSTLPSPGPVSSSSSPRSPAATKTGTFSSTSSSSGKSPPQSLIKGDQHTLSNTKSRVIRVWIQDFSFNIQSVVVFIGQRLEFRLASEVPNHCEHELVGESDVKELRFVSHLLRQDIPDEHDSTQSVFSTSFSFTPTVAGEITVRCSVDLEMVCYITVKVPPKERDEENETKKATQTLGTGILAHSSYKSKSETTADRKRRLAAGNAALLRANQSAAALTDDAHAKHSNVRDESTDNSTYNITSKYLDWNPLCDNDNIKSDSVNNATSSSSSSSSPQKPLSSPAKKDKNTALQASSDHATCEFESSSPSASASDNDDDNDNDDVSSGNAIRSGIVPPSPARSVTIVSPEQSSSKTSNSGVIKLSRRSGSPARTRGSARSGSNKRSSPHRSPHRIAKANAAALRAQSPLEINTTPSVVFDSTTGEGHSILRTFTSNRNSGQSSSVSSFYDSDDEYSEPNEFEDEEYAHHCDVGQEYDHQRHGEEFEEGEQYDECYNNDDDDDEDVDKGAYRGVDCGLFDGLSGCDESDTSNTNTTDHGRNNNNDNDDNDNDDDYRFSNRFQSHMQGFTESKRTLAKKQTVQHKQQSLLTPNDLLSGFSTVEIDEKEVARDMRALYLTNNDNRDNNNDDDDEDDSEEYHVDDTHQIRQEYEWQRSRYETSESRIETQVNADYQPHKQQSHSQTHSQSQTRGGGGGSGGWNSGFLNRNSNSNSGSYSRSSYNNTRQTKSHAHSGDNTATVKSRQQRSEIAVKYVEIDDNNMNPRTVNLLTGDAIVFTLSHNITICNQCMIACDGVFDEQLLLMPDSSCNFEFKHTFTHTGTFEVRSTVFCFLYCIVNVEQREDPVVESVLSVNAGAVELTTFNGSNGGGKMPQLRGSFGQTTAPPVPVFKQPITPPVPPPLPPSAAPAVVPSAALPLPADSSVTNSNSSNNSNISNSSNSLSFNTSHVKSPLAGTISGRKLPATSTSSITDLNRDILASTSATSVSTSTSSTAPTAGEGGAVNSTGAKAAVDRTAIDKSPLYTAFANHIGEKLMPELKSEDVMSLLSSYIHSNPKTVNSNNSNDNNSNSNIGAVNILKSLAKNQGSLAGASVNRNSAVSRMTASFQQSLNSGNLASGGAGVSPFLMPNDARLSPSFGGGINSGFGSVDASTVANTVTETAKAKSAAAAAKAKARKLKNAERKRALQKQQDEGAIGHIFDDDEDDDENDAESRRNKALNGTEEDTQFLLDMDVVGVSETVDSKHTVTDVTAVGSTASTRSAATTTTSLVDVAVEGGHQLQLQGVAEEENEDEQRQPLLSRDADGDVVDNPAGAGASAGGGKKKKKNKKSKAGSSIATTTPAITAPVTVTVSEASTATTTSSTAPQTAVVSHKSTYGTMDTEPIPAPLPEDAQVAEQFSGFDDDVFADVRDTVATSVNSATVGSYKPSSVSADLQSFIQTVTSSSSSSVVSAKYSETTPVQWRAEAETMKQQCVPLLLAESYDSEEDVGRDTREDRKTPVKPVKQSTQPIVSSVASPHQQKLFGSFTKPTDKAAEKTQPVVVAADNQKAIPLTLATTSDVSQVPPAQQNKKAQKKAAKQQRKAQEELALQQQKSKLEAELVESSQSQPQTQQSQLALPGPPPLVGAPPPLVPAVVAAASVPVGPPPLVSIAATMTSTAPKFTSSSSTTTAALSGASDLRPIKTEPTTVSATAKPVPPPLVSRSATVRSPTPPLVPPPLVPAARVAPPPLAPVVPSTAASGRPPLVPQTIALTSASVSAALSAAIERTPPAKKGKQNKSANSVASATSRQRTASQDWATTTGSANASASLVPRDGLLPAETLSTPQQKGRKGAKGKHTAASIVVPQEKAQPKYVPGILMDTQVVSEPSHGKIGVKQHKPAVSITTTTTVTAPLTTTTTTTMASVRDWHRDPPHSSTTMRGVSFSSRGTGYPDPSQYVGKHDESFKPLPLTASKVVAASAASAASVAGPFVSTTTPVVQTTVGPRPLTVQPQQNASTNALIAGGAGSAAVTVTSYDYAELAELLNDPSPVPVASSLKAASDDDVKQAVLQEQVAVEATRATPTKGKKQKAERQDAKADKVGKVEKQTLTKAERTATPVEIEKVSAAGAKGKKQRQAVKAEPPQHQQQQKDAVKTQAMATADAGVITATHSMPAPALVPEITSEGRKLSSKERKALLRKEKYAEKQLQQQQQQHEHQQQQEEQQQQQQQEHQQQQQEEQSVVDNAGALSSSSVPMDVVCDEDQTVAVFTEPVATSPLAAASVPTVPESADVASAQYWPPIVIGRVPDLPDLVAPEETSQSDVMPPEVTEVVEDMSEDIQSQHQQPQALEQGGDEEEESQLQEGEDEGECMGDGEIEAPGQLTAEQQASPEYQAYLAYQYQQQQQQQQLAYYHYCQQYHMYTQHQMHMQQQQQMYFQQQQQQQQFLQQQHPRPLPLQPNADEEGTVSSEASMAEEEGTVVGGVVYSQVMHETQEELTFVATSPESTEAACVVADGQAGSQLETTVGVQVPTVEAEEEEKVLLPVPKSLLPKLMPLLSSQTTAVAHNSSSSSSSGSGEKEAVSISNDQTSNSGASTGAAAVSVSDSSHSRSTAAKVNTAKLLSFVQKNNEKNNAASQNKNTSQKSPQPIAPSAAESVSVSQNNVSMPVLLPALVPATVALPVVVGPVENQSHDQELQQDQRQVVELSPDGTTVRDVKQAEEEDDEEYEFDDDYVSSSPEYAVIRERLMNRMRMIEDMFQNRQQDALPSGKKVSVAEIVVKSTTTGGAPITAKALAPVATAAAAAAAANPISETAAAATRSSVAALKITVDVSKNEIPSRHQQKNQKKGVQPQAQPQTQAPVPPQQQQRKQSHQVAPSPSLAVLTSEKTAISKQTNSSGSISGGSGVKRNFKNAKSGKQTQRQPKADKTEDK